ncbi:MAG TPA: transcriptional repressor [Bacteroidaceae bacterium]|nr:transcriptional repressor [Bacteroidaceae bacterium]
MSVREVFAKYLESNRKRKTPERFAILDTIYTMSGHFDIDALMKTMREERSIRVSRATLYNTLQLLVEARLIMCHKFGVNTQYEKSYNVDPHYHVICTECEEITEFHGNIKLKELVSLKKKRFTVTHYTLYIYGLCGKCSAAIKRRQKKIVKKK